VLLAFRIDYASWWRVRHAMEFVGKMVLYVIGGLIALGLAIWAVKAIVHFVLAVVLPVAIVAGIGYIIYRMVRPRALTGSSRSFLP
jgi:hypothetical protein